jgi:hypothetical protein
VYKVIEGASYTLSVHPDPKLDAYLDSLIEKIGAAQEKEGYLYTARTINPLEPHPWSGKEHWILEGVNSQELYDLGHLYEAAAARYAATESAPCWISRYAPPTCSATRSDPASARSGRAIGLWRWAWRNCTASPATCATSTWPGSCWMFAGRRVRSKAQAIPICRRR